MPSPMSTETLDTGERQRFPGRSAQWTLFWHRAARPAMVPVGYRPPDFKCGRGVGDARTGLFIQRYPIPRFFGCLGQREGSIRRALSTRRKGRDCATRTAAFATVSLYCYRGAYRTGFGYPYGFASQRAGIARLLLRHDEPVPPRNTGA